MSALISVYDTFQSDYTIKYSIPILTTQAFLSISLCRLH